MSRRPRKPSQLVALGLVVLLIAGSIGAVGAIIASGGSDDAPSVDTSPTLQLSRTSSTSGAVGAGGYQLAGTLPGGATKGVVIDPSGSRVSEAQVRKLLDSLGMTSVALSQMTRGWTATGTGAGQKAAFALDEEVGNLWQYGVGPLADCLSVQPGAEPDDSVSCAAEPTAAKPLPGPGRKALVEEAKQLFGVVGVTPGTGLKANDDGTGATYLDVPLTVEGLPVVDVNLSVGASKAGIVSALGLLNPTYSAVGEYPLVTSRVGLDQLTALPVPDIAPSCPAGKTCEPKPAKVTDARLAWLTSQDSGRTVLVPAWQYEVDGFFGPAVVAVEPQYLAAPPA